jgi:hypothetical protein
LTATEIAPQVWPPSSIESGDQPAARSIEPGALALRARREQIISTEQEARHNTHQVDLRMEWPAEPMTACRPG